MKRGYVLLAAVLAMVLVPGAAWCAVTVLEDFDDGETIVNLFEWAPFGAENITISEDTPNGSGYSNEILIDAWGGAYNDCYFSVLPDDGTTDLSGGSYINFYFKASADIDFPIFQCYGDGWFPGVAIWDWEGDGLPTEWTYFSFALTDFTDDWGWGSPATADQFEAIWQVEWYWLDEAQPTVTVYLDHVTLSDTPEEGMLGGGAPGGYPICVELGRDGDDVTMTWRDAEGAIAGDYEAVELYIAGIGVAEVTPGDPGSATFPWDDALESSDFAQLVLQDDGGEETESRIYFAVPYEVLPERIDMGYDTPAEAIEAGGNCEGVEPPPPPPVRIEGPGHKLLVGAELVLVMNPGDIDPTGWEWWRNGEDLGETSDTFSIGSVTTDDTGSYSCVITYDDGGGDAAYAEVEPSYYVWVTEAGLPLAGGLGLGLIAGACALAGVVAIRRKK
jgi:hypothetical protein